jgi:putative holliday junction resolvase
MNRKIRDKRPNSSPSITGPKTDHFQGDILPTEGRLAGIDLGTVRVGIAVCDPSQKWTSPCETWNRQPGKEESYFRELVKREAIVGFVVGLPLHNSGRESEISLAVRKFALWLKNTLLLPVALFDERFSSAHATHLLSDMGATSKRRKERLDQLAAHVILEAFLESNRTLPIGHNPIDDDQK